MAKLGIVILGVTLMPFVLYFGYWVAKYKFRVNNPGSWSVAALAVYGALVASIVRFLVSRGWYPD